MACPWWDNDYKHVIRGSSFKDEKGKSHEKKDKSQSHEKKDKSQSHGKGKMHHEGKMKEQNLPEKSYGQGYKSGYVKGYEDGYVKGYEQGCENTRDTKFGNGYSGHQDSGKRSEYHGYSTSGYIFKRSEITFEYYQDYELDNDPTSDIEEYDYDDDEAGYLTDY